MKKMTNKEFKEALDKAGYAFEVYGYEGILNMISLNSKRSAKELDEAHMNAAARSEREKADALFNILNERGYYNE